jgi:hypothetical protein
MLKDDEFTDHSQSGGANAQLSAPSQMRGVAAVLVGRACIFAGTYQVGQDAIGSGH